MSKTGPKPRPLAARLWQRVMKTDTCWLWTGATGPTGYGVTYNNGKNQYVHRAVYELLVGPIPDGLQIDHLCRVRNCVNPDHLEPVTPQENTRRGDAWKWRLRRTHCRRGHEYSAENTVMRQGGRWCRACSRLWSTEYYQQKKAKQAADTP